MTTPRYGSEVTPNEPTQDMNAIDTLVGSVMTRDDSPAAFTGGTGGQGLGGMAEPPAPTKAGVTPSGNI